ncbi:MAG TPA: VanW family protein [Bacillota bacterium]|nr:VanW family protein [Bacillota bacterium]
MDLATTIKKLLLKKWLKILLLACGTAFLLAAVIMLCDFCYFYSRAYPGLYLETIDVGNMRLEEVEALLDEKLWSLEELQFSTAGGEKMTLSLSDLGLSWDRQGTMEKIYRAGRGWKGYAVRLHSLRTGNPIIVRGEIKVDELRLAGAMAGLAKQLYHPPRDAFFEVEGETVSIIPEQEGQYLKTAALRELIFYSLYEEEKEILLPVGEWPAARTAADLENFGVGGVMASFYTDVAAGNPDRAYNIKLGASAINATLLAPGELFSFNEVVGETTASKGYRYAPIIVGDELVPGLGGGLCQVSTTLYNAALLANLEIVERHNHSMRISYIPLGRDATVATGSLDLKFRNNRDHYILIGADLNNLRLTFRIFGPPMKEKVEIISSGYQQIAPPINYEYSDALPAGVTEVVKPGQAGYYITTWRVVYLDDQEISREMLFRDYYRPTPALHRVGTGDD